jgi:NAD(P)-dependent dehydrogenase (short-subunit alcohol dehydrogenase family)
MGEWRFDGKVALVTGAGRGAGRAHALSLAQRGARVVVVDPGVTIEGSGYSQAPADEVVSEIRAAGGQAVACYESVTDERGAAAMVQVALDHFGQLDILINNAGIAGPELFEAHSAEEFRRMIDVHYLGTVYVTQAAYGHFMARGRGRIVNTVSEGATGPLPKMTAYGGAKGAVIGFTLALAAEAPRHGISVNGFAPRVSSRMSSPTVLGKVHDLPPERFAPIENAFAADLCSPAAIYLAHDECPLNGAILVCGGGQVMRLGFKQNQGYSSKSLSVEEIADHIAHIVDLSGAPDVEVASIAANGRS